VPFFVWPLTLRAGQGFVQEERIANPGVKFPPPLLFVAGFVAGWMLHRRWPHHVVPHAWERGAQGLGAVAIATAVGVMAWAFATFIRHRTAIYPNRPAARIVRDGPFRWTRNPMYISMTLLYVGLAFILNALVPLFFLPLVLFLLVTLVIHREERYLASAFGEDYDAYRREVGRWL